MSIISVVYAQLKEWDSPAEEPADFGDLEIVIENILSLVTTTAGIIVLIMLLLGGFQFLTAGANPEKTQQAKKTITMAVAGLALLIITWFIILLIETFTGAEITLFKIVD
jgi:predicted small integral membrane protein